jgi:hypothetical protein
MYAVTRMLTEGLHDNLHGAYGLKRHGIGIRLLALTGEAALDVSPS